MIEEEKIRKALQKEVEEAQFSKDVWKRVKERVSYEARKSFFERLVSSRLAAAVSICLIIIISMGAGAGLILWRESPADTPVFLAEGIIEIEAHARDDREIVVQGWAQLPEDAPVKLIASRELNYSREGELQQEEILLGYGTARMKNGKFSSTLKLLEEETLYAKIKEGLYEEERETLKPSEEVQLTALYLPQALEDPAVYEAEKQEEAQAFTAQEKEEYETVEEPLPEAEVEDGPKKNDASVEEKEPSNVPHYGTAVINIPLEGRE